MIKYHHQVDISEHCFSTASIFLIKWVISNSFSQHEKFVFSLVHIHRDPPPFHSIQPPPPIPYIKIKDQKIENAGANVGSWRGSRPQATGIHIWLSKVNSSSRLPKHIKMLYLVIHASMKVNALQKKIHNRRYR